MTDQEIIEKTNKVFEESFEIEKERLVPQAHIFTDLGLDSLDIVDLIVALQNTLRRQDPERRKGQGHPHACRISTSSFPRSRTRKAKRAHDAG